MVVCICYDGCEMPETLEDLTFPEWKAELDSLLKAKRMPLTTTEMASDKLLKAFGAGVSPLQYFERLDPLNYKSSQSSTSPNPTWEVLKADDKPRWITLGTWGLLQLAASAIGIYVAWTMDVNTPGTATVNLDLLAQRLMIFIGATAAGACAVIYFAAGEIVRATKEKD